MSQTLFPDTLIYLDFSIPKLQFDRKDRYEAGVYLYWAEKCIKGHSVHLACTPVVVAARGLSPSKRWDLNESLEIVN